MKNLFAFTFHIQTVDMNQDLVVCMVYGETYFDACEVVLNLGLPIAASDEKGLNKCLREVFQCTDEEAAESK